MFGNRLVHLSVLLLAAGSLASSQEKVNPAMSDKEKQGHEVFLHSAKGTSCSTCHLMAGEGTAVGPDLCVLAGAATPAGLRMAILATLTSYVQLVKLENGKVFPAMIVKGNGTDAEYWDLSKTPPQARNLTKKEIASVSNNDQWKHPPESTGYTDDELAGVISYLRYVAHNNPAKAN